MTATEWTGLGDERTSQERRAWIREKRESMEERKGIECHHPTEWPGNSCCCAHEFWERKSDSCCRHTSIHLFNQALNPEFVSRVQSLTSFHLMSDSALESGVNVLRSHRLSLSCCCCAAIVFSRFCRCITCCCIQSLQLFDPFPIPDLTQVFLRFH